MINYPARSKVLSPRPRAPILKLALAGALLLLTGCSYAKGGRGMLPVGAGDVVDTWKHRVTVEPAGVSGRPGSDHPGSRSADLRVPDLCRSGDGGGRSFKDSMIRLQESARTIADQDLHTPIRAREVIPAFPQVDFRPELDLLLAEVVRRLKP